MECSMKQILSQPKNTFRSLILAKAIRQFQQQFSEDRLHILLIHSVVCYKNIAIDAALLNQWKLLISNGFMNLVSGGAQAEFTFVYHVLF